MMNKKTELTIYSGINTIGGLIFSVSYGNDRVILEMGSSYDPTKDVFDGVVKARNKNWLADKLRLGIIPKIHGIFREQDLNGYKEVIPFEQSKFNTAVFITHIHLDHMAHIGAVAPEIPVYLHKNAQIIERALEEVGSGVDSIKREYTEFEEENIIKTGAIEVIPYKTSRKSYYAFCFLIKTPDGKIHWTGDFTLHSEDKDLTLHQMHVLQKEKIDVLFCDCTSFMDSVLSLMYESTDASLIKPSPDVPSNMQTDKEYYTSFYDKFKKTKGLCVFNFYDREMDEASMFIDWADKLGRICCFEPETAYIVYKFLKINPYVYIPDTELFTMEQKDKKEWFNELMKNSIVISLEEINCNPSKYMVQNSYKNIMELFSLPSENSTYVHCGGLPIGEFDPAYKKLMLLIEKTGFEYLTNFCENYFGHGYPCQVKYFVDKVNPAVLIPCHSHNPERLLPKDGIQLIPKNYSKYELKNRNLIEIKGDKI